MNVYYQKKFKINKSFCSNDKRKIKYIFNQIKNSIFDVMHF